MDEAEHPAVTRMREREARAVARGYTDGDVNHNVQQIIGHLRLHLMHGTPLDAGWVEYACGKLTLACDAEVAWLAIRDAKDDQS